VVLCFNFAFGRFLGLVTIFAVVGVGMIRPLSTQLTAAGVSQRTLRGRLELRWAGVTSVTTRPQAIVLKSSAQRIIVPLVFFNDYDAAVAYIGARLPSAVRDAAQ